MSVSIFFRVIAAVSLLGLAFAVIDPFAMIAHHYVTDSVKAHLHSIAITNCKYICNKFNLAVTKCSQIQLLLFSLLVSCAVLILFRGTKAALLLSSMAIAIWAFFYANVGIDGSYQNWDWALQAFIISTGLLALAARQSYAKNRNIDIQ